MSCGSGNPLCEQLDEPGYQLPPLVLRASYQGSGLKPSKCSWNLLLAIDPPSILEGSDISKGVPISLDLLQTSDIRAAATQSRECVMRRMLARSLHYALESGRLGQYIGPLM